MKKIIFSFLTLIVFSGTYAQKTGLDRTKRPVPGPAPSIKLGNIQSFELPNGLKVFLVENHKVPTIAYSIALDIHAAPEGETAGLSNITGELLTCGTKTRSKDQLDSDIDFIGATVVASPKGLYGSSLKKQNTKLLELMSDVLLNADFKQAELDKLKNQTLSGLAQQKDDPDAISNNVRAVLNFGSDHPYGEITTEESVSKITLEKCNTYYKTYFRPNVAYMAIVGDVTLAEIKPLIEKYFGGWEKTNVPSANYKTPAAPAKTRVAVVNKAGAVQSVINVTYPVDLKQNSSDAIKAKVMNTILGAGFSSRLFVNLREKHGYTYGAYSSLNQDELVGDFNAYAKVRNAVTDSSLTEIMFEMNRIRNEKVSVEELEGIKNYLTGSFAISLEDPETVARFAINIERYKLPKDYYENYLKNLAAVSVDDVFNMAQKYIRPENATVLIVGDKVEVTKKVETFSASKKAEFYDAYGKPVVEVTIKPAPAGVTGKTVIDAYVKAIGGAKALAAVKDIRVKLNTEVQGRPIVMEVSRKAPNKYKTEIKMGPMVIQQQTYDGKVGKESGMQGKREISGAELTDLQAEAVLNQEMNYEKSGYKLNVKGVEPVNGSDAYVLELESPAGKKSTEWYDVTSGLKVKAVATNTNAMGTMTQTSEFKEYRDVNGMKYPGIVSITGTPMPLMLKLESVEVNTGIKDTEFSGE